MSVTGIGWKNKVGTSDRTCKCGTWKQHWINNASKTWPRNCSISGCANTATLGAHIINKSVDGEKIIPSCDACNKLSNEFDLVDGTILVSANKSETCE